MGLEFTEMKASTGLATPPNRWWMVSLPDGEWMGRIDHDTSTGVVLFDQAGGDPLTDIMVMQIAEFMREIGENENVSIEVSV